MQKKCDTRCSVKAIEVKGGSFDWLTGVQEALAEKEPNMRVYLWTREDEAECGLVGLVRCIRKEPGGERVHGIVFPKHAADPTFESPNDELQSILENQLAINVFRNNRWGSYAHVPLSNTAKNVTIDNFCLCSPKKDGVAGVRWLQIPADTEGKEQRVSVSYAGINFHEVMVASGTLADARNPLGCLGMEFSGYDSKGHRVMGLATYGALGTSVVPVKYALWKVPPSWTLEDAATIPIAYSTVILGLIGHGRIRRGQSVLVHSGSGGTGLAAITVALAMGCEVFTTVGSPKKQEILLKLFPQIRRERIGNSRDHTFAEMIMTETQGKGVDLALSSLTGELGETTFQCIAKGGKLIDISATDNSARLELRHNMGYQSVVMDQLDYEGHDFRQMGQMVQDAIDKGLVTPLSRSVFPRESVVEALQAAQKGTHFGKILISMESSASSTSPVEVEQKVYFRSDRLYVVVGGLGGIGFEVVNWIVARGGRNIMILSRSNQKNGFHAYNLRRLRNKHNATINIVKADVSDASVCENLISLAESTHGVAGIFISALVSLHAGGLI